MSDIRQAWPDFFMSQAYAWSERSKDPSTKVGAVVVCDNHIVGAGYNGFPRGVLDLHERLNDRTQKYPRVVHAEVNAVLEALKHTSSVLQFHTMYCTMCPCPACMGIIINSGLIDFVVCPTIDYKHERWGETFRISAEMAMEANVGLMTMEEYKSEFSN